MAVKYNDQKAAADHANKNAFVLTFMNYSGKDVLPNEFCHAGCCSNIAGRERRKARGIHVADIAVECDRLAVAIDEKDNTRGTLDPHAFQNGADLIILLFL